MKRIAHLSHPSMASKKLQQKVSAQQSVLPETLFIDKPPAQALSEDFASFVIVSNDS
jgi:hypothetical protein